MFGLLLIIVIAAGIVSVAFGTTAGWIAALVLAAAGAVAWYTRPDWFVDKPTRKKR